MTSRASGKPTPGAWVLGGGYTAWFSGVSGMEIAVPSTSFTARGDGQTVQLTAPATPEHVLRALAQ